MEAVLLYDHRWATTGWRGDGSPDGSPELVTPVRAGCIQLGRRLELLPTQLRIREQLIQTSGNVGAAALGPIVCYSLASQLCQLTL